MTHPNKLTVQVSKPQSESSLWTEVTYYDTDSESYLYEGNLQWDNPTDGDPKAKELVGYHILVRIPK